MTNDPFVQKAAALIKPFLRKDDRLFVFGSRTKTSHHLYSDIDIGVDTKTPLPLGVLSHISDILEESDLPVNVDVVDFSLVSKAFASIAKQSAQPL